jgi:FMN phosphatase YigB (HAD superfamily)
MNLRERRKKFDKLLKSRSIKIESWQKILSTCPSCGYPTIGERSNYDICELCGWEDVGQDDWDADEIEGGPNGQLSLTDSRNLFEQKFRSDRKLIKNNPLDEMRVQLIKLYDSLIEENNNNLNEKCKSISLLKQKFMDTLIQKNHDVSRNIEAERKERDQLIEKSRNSIDTIIFDFSFLFKELKHKNDNPLLDRIKFDMNYHPYNNELKKTIVKSCSIKEKQFERVIEEILNRYKKFDRLWEVMPLLRNNYKLAVIEDADLSISQLLREKFELDKYFDFILIPEKPFMKMENNTYRYILRKLDSLPQNTLFVDKGYSPGIANQMGIHTIMWMDHEEGFDKLQQLLGMSSMKQS